MPPSCLTMPYHDGREGGREEGMKGQEREGGRKEGKMEERKVVCKGWQEKIRKEERE